MIVFVGHLEGTDLHLATNNNYFVTASVLSIRLDVLTYLASLVLLRLPFHPKENEHT